MTSFPRCRRLDATVAAGFCCTDMRSIWPIFALLLIACGANQERATTPDESGDLQVSTAPPPVERGPAPLPPDLHGSRWRWVEAHCTEGPLDLLSRGYAATMRVSMDSEGLTLVTDQQFATESCVHTLVTRATPPEAGSEWQMEELQRIAVPSDPACYGRPELPRPGEVRDRSGRLEVLVQRSQWCNGLEVRMVWERAETVLLSDEEIIRRYFAHFSDGDATAVASLFAETGSLLEPFTRTVTGDPYRHDGRESVQRWFTETFETAPWRALRITEIVEGAADGESSHRSVTWEYMDPRLEQPFSGVSRFTIAAGEIFELQIELTTEPRLTAPAEGEPAEGA